MADKDLNQRGIENEIEGSSKELGGKVRGKVGDVLDNEDEQARGKMDEMKGKVQKNFGKAERKLDEKI